MKNITPYTEKKSLGEGMVIQIPEQKGLFVVTDIEYHAQSRCHNDIIDSYYVYTIKKLRSDKTYNPNARDRNLTFYSLYNYSVDEVTVVGEMKKVVTFI